MGPHSPAWYMRGPCAENMLAMYPLGMQNCPLGSSGGPGAGAGAQRTILLTLNWRRKDQ